MVEVEDRYLGALFGCAIGDALGTTLENQRTPKELLRDIVGGGPFQLLPGCWTDDTTMMLLLSESLIEKRGFDPQDQLARYLEWYREGKLSSNGECFDIGITTRMAVEKFEKKPEDYPATVGEKARAGNGSLMRICPIPLRYRKNPEEAMQRAIDSSRTTHGSVMCTDACRYYTALFLGIFQGFTKDQLLQSSFLPNASDYWTTQPLCSEVQNVVVGSWRSKDELRSTGFVIDSLECALWAFETSDNFRDGLVKIVNLGGDSDTAGAIYGQLAGCYYGYQQLPTEWREKVALKSLINVFAKELFSDSEGKETTNEYRELQKCYKTLESSYKPILRKLLPGPRAYKEMSDFENDVQEFIKTYQSNCSNTFPELLHDFQSRFEYNKENLKKKLDRANMFAKR